MKITKQFNWRVVVEPRGLGNFGIASISDYAIEPDEEKREARYKAMCEDIMEQIKRHIDDVGNVYLDCDTEEVCSYCRRTWEVNEDPNDPDAELGQPLCCHKAIEEWRANKCQSDIK